MRDMEQAFAVVRRDLIASDLPQSLGSDAGLYITVKEVVWNLEDAKSEVEKLMKLNAEKGCVYFWQTTSVVHRP